MPLDSTFFIPRCSHCSHFKYVRPWLGNYNLGSCVYGMFRFKPDLTLTFTCSCTLSCSHFISKFSDVQAFDYNEVVGEQLTLF